MLPLIRKHEDKVEADLQRYFQQDYRDVFREGGGPSKLTVRRLLVLVAGLPPESGFSSSMEDRLPVSEVSAAVGDLYRALTGKTWGRWDALEKAREQRERKRLLEVKREEARKFNAARTRP